MPKVDLSPKVLGEIWLRAEAGDEDVNVVLLRILGMAGSDRGPRSRSLSSAVKGDFIDPKYHVRFPEGFEIHRSYKGKNYKAQVVNGLWEIEGVDKRLLSLNALNREIGVETENAWVSWWYEDSTTKERKHIAELRDPEMVRKRKK
jgi:hypothetical protein